MGVEWRRGDRTANSRPSESLQLRPKGFRRTSTDRVLVPIRTDDSDTSVKKPGGGLMAVIPSSLSAERAAGAAAGEGDEKRNWPVLCFSAFMETFSRI